MTLTYGELRSNAERIADEQIKESVLRGIEVLNAWDPGWPGYIDPSELLLSSPIQCVLGQVFDSVLEIEPEKIEAFKVAQPSLGSSFEEQEVSSVPGYFKGLAVLDGDVMVNPSAFGFDHDEGMVSYDMLDEAWLTVLGQDG